MQTWSNLSDGRHKLTISEPGVPSSTYTGTYEEIANMLAKSQQNANRRIAELRQQPNGTEQPPPSAQPVTRLSPEDRLRTVAELNNPETVDTAVVRVMESQIGSMAEQRQRQAETDQERYDRQSKDMAIRFATETPEWYGSEFNRNSLADYMLNNRMDFRVRENYDLAFERLSSAGLLQPKPGSETQEVESEENDLEPNAPAPKAVVPRTPTRISTGITSRDISGSPPRPTTRLRYTREQLETMGAAEMKRLMLTDRAELERCTDYYAKHPVPIKRQA